MLIYGHRGAAGEAPENTIAGLRHLIGLGLQRVEIDLRLSRDGELMVVHDRSLKRTHGVPGLVSSLTSAALIERSGRDAVPSLLQLLQACPELTHLQLELKPAPARERLPIARRLVETLSFAGAPLTRYCATSSDPKLLAVVRSVAPELQRGLVITRRRDVTTLMKLGCSLACVHYLLLDRFFLHRLRRMKAKVSAWTVNSGDALQRMCRLGCDSVITDFPSQLSSALERSAKQQPFGLGHHELKRGR
ncbi:MAG: glycerophosphodiester phosphodiesterase [Pseudomonadota bacterium]